MTKVELHYDLVRPLSDQDLDAVARVHGVYGIIRVVLKQPELNGVTVEYDASRLTDDEVEAALIRSGIPIQRR
ncbi:MAG: hypothetical protein NZV14_15000 [Bryobacteraceae bacterium]|nr:hypothetical protein [Bryobacteraceae bacterium]MDW8379470.1 hypothetical protein [Bryobacterales bacterium]